MAWSSMHVSTSNGVPWWHRVRWWQCVWVCVLHENLSICIWHKHSGNMRKDVRTEWTSCDGLRRPFHSSVAPRATTNEMRTKYKDRANRARGREEKIISGAGAGKLKRCGHWNRQPTQAKTSGNTVSSNFNENIEETTPWKIFICNFAPTSVLKCECGARAQCLGANEPDNFASVVCGMLQKAFSPRISHAFETIFARIAFDVISENVVLGFSSSRSSSLRR